MAPRIGFKLDTLRLMAPGACPDDIRLVWRDGDRLNLGLVNVREYPGSERFVNLPSFCGPREVRLLGLQLIAHADELERDCDPTEVVLP